MITMRHKAEAGNKTFSGKMRMDVAINIAAFVLLFLTILFYTQAVMFEDQEITALLLACYLFLGVYMGRYVTHLWIHTDKTIPNRIFIILFLLIILCLIWVLLLPRFSFNNSNLPGILLFAVPLLLISLSAGVLIKLVRIRVQRQLQSAKAQAQHSQSELEMLQSQLSPHFLFNTLNNMYGLSITRPEKVPPLLLKLSDLLRYSVYDVKELYVPLKNEIAYLLNYIDFEKIRIGEKLNLATSIEEVKDDRIKIAPMLLIVFIENAFKHAKNTADKEIYVDISLKTADDLILFSVKNSHSKSIVENKLIRKDSGLGLVNAQKRLDLLYAGAYDLNIESDECLYSVTLQLKVK